jgi:CelD/BcsL family acetyltransferase involved in cellulose biosynthesis
MIETTVWRSFPDAEATVRPFLAGHARNPFLGFDWTAEYSRCVREPQGWQPLLMGFFRAGRMVAFAPLALRRRLGGIRIVTFAGEGRSPYLGLAGETSPEIVAALRTQALRVSPHSVLYLSGVPEGDPLLSHFNPASGLAAVRQTLLCDCLFRDVRLGVADGTPSHRRARKYIPRQIERLSALGEVRQVVLDFDAARQEALAWLPRLFALHDLRHHDRWNIWTAPVIREFLCAYLERAEPSNSLCFVLLLDGVPVSFELGLRIENGFCVLVTAFHPAFQSISVSQANRYLAFGACGRMGIQNYDFARGDSPAKRVWASGRRASFELVAAAGTSWRARLAARMLAGKTRARIWARDHGLRQAKFMVWLSGWIARARRFPRIKGTAPPPVPPRQRPAPEVPLRFRDVANLPVEALAVVLKSAISR